MVVCMKLTETGDLDFSSGHGSWIIEEEGVAQHVKIRLNMFRGEWFLDSSEGTPYREYIVGLKDLELAKLVIKKRIESTPNILKPLSILDVDLNTKSRKMNVSFEGRTIFGDIDLDNLDISL